MNAKLIPEPYSFEKEFFGRPVDDILDHGFFNSIDTNIIETETRYELEVAVPGMTRNDIQLNVAHHKLLITGRREECQAGFFQQRQREFTSTFYRSYSLPKDADTDGIQASCKNGMMRISIPKLVTDSHYRVIPIEVAEESGNPHLFKRWWQPFKAWFNKHFGKK